MVELGPTDDLTAAQEAKLLAKHKNVETGVEVITPKTAIAMLEHNTMNRPITQAVVDRYAAAMKNNTWDMNGQTIIVAKTGEIINGQHQLWAVIQAGVAVCINVARGVDKETFVSVDEFNKRRNKDVIGIKYREFTNLSSLAAACAVCIKYRTGKATQNKPIPNYVSLDYFDNNQELAAWVKLARERRGWAVQHCAPIAAVAYLASHTNKYKAKAATFVTQFNTGEGLHSGSPILALRNRLATDTHMPRVMRLALIIFAWNNFAKDKNVSKLQVPRSEEFPTIVGAEKVLA